MAPTESGLIPAAVLLHVPGCESGEPPLQVTRLRGGRDVNLNLRIETRRGDFVLRQRQSQGETPGALVARELAAQRCAAAAGLAPAVLAAADDGRWILMEFVSGGMWTQDALLAPAAVAALGGRLATLHELRPATGIAEVDVEAIVEGQVGAILRREPGAERQLHALQAQASLLIARCAQLAGPLSINHGDLDVSNLLGPAPILVDWEYSQLADPVYDVACLLSYYPALQGREAELLHAAGLHGDRSRRRLPLQTALFRIVNTLWAWAEQVPTGK